MLRKKTIGLALAGAMILPTGSVFADENMVLSKVS